MYVTYFLVFLGTSIATASWLFGLFLILFTVGTAAFVDFEEKRCLEQYGNIYREYRDRTKVDRNSKIKSKLRLLVHYFRGVHCILILINLSLLLLTPDTLFQFRHSYKSCESRSVWGAKTFQAL